MKGYISPSPIEKGTCFLCLEKCPPNAVIHLACGLAYSEEKEKRIEEANKKAKEKDG